MTTLTEAEALLGTLDERTLRILEHRRSTAKPRRRGWWIRRALLAADVSGLIAGFLVAKAYAHWWAPDPGAIDPVDDVWEYALLFLFIPLWVFLAKLYGLYDHDEERADHGTSDDLVGIFHLVTVIAWALYGTAILTHVFAPVPERLLLFWLASIAAVVAARSIARTVCRRRLGYVQNTIIVGADDTGWMIARKLLNHPETGINVVGFVPAENETDTAGPGPLSVLGHLEQLPQLTQLLAVERVIVAAPGDALDATWDQIETLRGMDVQVDIVPRLVEKLGPALQIHMVEGLPLAGLPPTHLSRSDLLLKRAMDIVGAALCLLVLAPLFLVVAVLIKLDSRGPVFYRSTRVGRRGLPFVAYKFRTMRVDADEELRQMLLDPRTHVEFERTHKLASDPRITRFGTLLRLSSLDELPQLFNILRGDLSLVGPRPITATEYDLMADSERAAAYWSISDLRPGLTGYWQVNGRSRLSYEDRVRLDLSYIENWSLELDLQILARTARVLLGRSGAV